MTKKGLLLRKKERKKERKIERVVPSIHVAKPEVSFEKNFPLG